MFIIYPGIDTEQSTPNAKSELVDTGAHLTI